MLLERGVVDEDVEPPEPLDGATDGLLTEVRARDVPREEERPAQPEEIAPAFVFFASEADSSYITGEVITLLGGETTGAA